MEKWSRADKLTVGGLIFAAVAAIAAVFVVPEFREFFHLDKPHTTQTQAETSTQTIAPSIPARTEPKSEPLKPEAKPKTHKPTQTRVTGDGNVAGNNISDDLNVTGNNNQTPIAIAPNGIAIYGGMVTNPTVNNFGKPSSSRHLTESQKNTLIASLKKIDPQSFYFLSAPDAESTHFGNEVLKMLTSHELGWKVLPLPSNWGQANRQGEGLFIVVSDLQKPPPGTVELQQAFKAVGINASGTTYPMVGTDRFAIYVGVNPVSE